MMKLIAKMFLALLLVGSISGCLVDDRRGGGGMRGGEHMDRGGDEHRGGMDRDDHRGDRR